MERQIIQLTESEQRSLTTILSRGTRRARELTRARILDLLGRREHPSVVAVLLKVSMTTVYTIRNRYLAEGLEAALKDKPRSGRPNIITGQQKASLTALACSEAPEGHARWSLRLLADKAVELEFVGSISHNHVRQILKKTL